MARLRTFYLALGTALAVFDAQAATRSSANYTLPNDINDAAGLRATSASYAALASLGSFGGIASVNAPAEINKSGYIGQLYEVVALSVTAPPSNDLNENSSRQLVAAPLADDNTTLAALDPSTVAWSSLTGPIASISSSGIATAGIVYQDSAAAVRGTANSLSGQFNLTILNVNDDDFGSYAGDGIDDSWQVQYFGLNNPSAAPNADPDGDGQTNLFEFTAGLIPNDPSSRFFLRVAEGAAASAKNLFLTPSVAGRSYSVQFSVDLAPNSWQPLTGSTQSDAGSTRTVTDPNAGARKMYRVQITKP